MIRATTLVVAGILIFGAAAVASASGEHDISTPREALKAQMHAELSDDLETLKTLITGHPAAVEDHLASLEALAAGHRLHEACVSRFKQSNRFMGRPAHTPQQIQRQVAAIDQLELVEGDDEAKLYVKGRKGVPAVMRKTDGVWKRDVDEIFEIHTVEKLRENALTNRCEAQAARETADAIDAGQFKTIKEAQAARDKRFGQLLREARGKQQENPSATRPASGGDTERKR